MCDNCKNIVLRDSFYSPRDYLNCLDYIQFIVAQGKYEIISHTCALDKVKSANGQWISDTITHVIRCKICGQEFTCFCDTYHGSGGFHHNN